MKKKNVIKSILFIMLVLPLTVNTLLDDFGFPKELTYINDMLWIILFFVNIHYLFNVRFVRLKLTPILFIWLGLLIVIVISIFVNGGQLRLIIWGTRNIIRFFVFFTSCVLFLDYHDVLRIFKIFFIANLFSFLLALYQFFILGLSQDSLGGIFGHGNGAALNTFQSLLYSYYLSEFLNKRKSLLSFIVVMLTTIIIAALAEEKAYFIYIVIITSICLLLSKLSMKTVTTVIIVVLLIPFGIDLLIGNNSELNRAVFSSFDGFMDYGNSAYAISRINPFPQIDLIFFNNNFWNKIIGLGFGNAQISEGSMFFTSEIGMRFGYLQYSFFPSQLLYIETGYFGFVLYVMFFCYMLYYSIRLYYKNNGKYNIIVGSSIAFIPVIILSMWLSGALFAKEAYIVYFGLAISPIIYKNLILEDEVSSNDK